MKLGLLPLALLCQGCQFFDLARKEEAKLEEVRGTALELAVDNAKSSVDYFTISVRKRDGEKFSARVQHPKYEAFEKSLWLKNVIRKPGDRWSGTYQGPVPNPFGAKTGQIVKFERDQILDWLIVREGIRYGGFTVGLEPSVSTNRKDKIAKRAATSSRNPFEKPAPSR